MLRGFDTDEDVGEAIDKLVRGNTYEATLQCLCRGMVTLSKLQPITPIYRAMATPLLPESFWKPDALGRRVGGVEAAVSVGSPVREQSLQYFRERGLGVLLDFKVDAINRPANLAWLDGFKGQTVSRNGGIDAWRSFPPMTALEVVRERMDYMESELAFQKTAVRYWKVNISNSKIERTDYKDLQEVRWRGDPPPDTENLLIISVEERDGGAVVLENGAVFNNYFTGPRRFLVLEIKPHCQRG